MIGQNVGHQNTQTYTKTR